MLDQPKPEEVKVECRTCAHSHALTGELTCCNSLSVFRGHVEPTDSCGQWTESCFV
jgi:hypothetical protein